MLMIFFSIAKCVQLDKVFKETVSLSEQKGGVTNFTSDIFPNTILLGIRYFWEFDTFGN